MKTLIKISAILALVFVSIALLSSCQSASENDREKSEFEKARNETVKKLEDLKTDIEIRIEDINQRLDGASGELQEGLERAREELLEERSKAEKALDDLKNATSDSWDKVRDFAEATYESGKKNVEKIASDIESWFK